MKIPNLGEAHCGEGAPQSAQRSLEFVFWISSSFERVSGSTSHMALLVMLAIGVRVRAVRTHE